MEDRSSAVFVVALIFTILGTIFVLLRMISRGLVVKSLNWGDGLIVVAWIAACIASVAIMVSTFYGLGKHDSRIEDVDRDTLKRMMYIFSILYNPVLMATKSSILLLYLSMKTYDRFFRYASIFLLCLVNIAGLVLTLLNIFQCRPVSAALDWNPPEAATCIQIVSLYLCSAPINVLTDIAVILLPLPILTGMRMESKQKAVLVATFCTGIFVTVVDIIRIAYLQDALSIAVEFTHSSHADYKDFAWQASLSFMWSVVEMHVGIACACVLVLKPLVRKMFPGIMLDAPKMPSGQFEGQATFPPFDGREETGNALTEGERLSPTNRGSIIPLPEAEVAEFLTGQSVPPSTGPAYPSSPCPVAAPPESNRESSLSTDSGNCNTAVEIRKLTVGSIKSEKPREPQFKAKEIDLNDMDIMDFLAVDQSGKGDNIRPWDPDNCDIPDIPELATLDQVCVDHLLAPSAGTVARPNKCVVPVRCAPTVVSGQAPPAAFSDFIVFHDINSNSLLDLTAREAWRPVLLVSILFSVWGLAYGFLGSVTSQIRRILEFSEEENLAQYNAYWIAYAVGPILGYIVLSRFGFKATFLVGLGILSCGAMSFWPATTLTSFSGLFVSQFIISFGLSLLEIAANPYIALAGPQHLAEARLNFAQAVQATTGALTPILSRKVLLRSVTDRSRLVDTQWAYLAIALFVITLGVLFFYIAIPEASDKDLQRVSRQRLHAVGLGPDSTIGGASAGGILAGFGIVTMLVYMGAQESLSYFWPAIVHEMKPAASNNATWGYSEAALSCFAVGRFLASGIAYLGVPGRYILTVCTAVALVTTVLAAHLPLGNGDAPLAMLMLTYLFEGPIFPTLFAMVIRNQGVRTKLVSMGLTIAIGGGGILPSITFALRHKQSARQSINIVVGFLAVGMVLPLLVNASSTLRRWVEPRIETSGHCRSESDTSAVSTGKLRKVVSDYLSRFSIEHREYADDMEMNRRKADAQRTDA